MSEHTPEPWTLINDKDFCAVNDQANDNTMLGECYGQDAKSNARRIVACVNACRGIETKTLESDIGTAIKGIILADSLKNVSRSLESERYVAGELVKQRDAALRERDEARAMVKCLADALRNLEDCDDYEELISEADPQDIPESVTCPSCYRVWPGSPHRCEACHTLLDYA